MKSLALGELGPRQKIRCVDGRSLPSTPLRAPDRRPWTERKDAHDDTGQADDRDPDTAMSLPIHHMLVESATPRAGDARTRATHLLRAERQGLLVVTGRATEWEPEADQWIEWARTPGFDAYWTFRDSFFEEVLSPAGSRTLEVGCGEGRVARDLALRGHNVVAVEPAHRLLAAASAAGSTSEHYAVADGTMLPFADAAFDVVVAYNVLQVVDDLDLTLSEVARVLVPGGHLCACIAHPVTDLGDVVEGSNGPRLTIRENYLRPRRIDDEIEVDGHPMKFHGWTHSLQDYSLGLERAGFVLERLREPCPDVSDSTNRRWKAAPLFLNFRAALSRRA